MDFNSIPFFPQNNNHYLTSELDDPLERHFQKNLYDLFPEDVNVLSNLFNYCFSEKIIEDPINDNFPWFLDTGSFNTEKKSENKKRGQKTSKKQRYGIHGKEKFDNLLTKIQVHYFTFLIDFCNDALKKEFQISKDSFKYINNKFKTNVSFKHISNLMNLSIKEILNMEMAKKYKRFKKSNNMDLLEKIESKSKFLSELFQKNYLELFYIYYNNERPLEKMMFGNEEIILSKKTKSFYYLLEKEKNKDLRQKLIATAKSVYFGANENYGNKFSTTIIH
jgi:hypothetical protein